MAEAERFRVLVADPIAPEGVERLRQGADVDVLTGQLPEELLERIPAYHALVVRSETRVTADLLRRGQLLRVVARAGVGVDNIDVPAATERGIIVVNSPEGNTIAAAEHTIAMLLALSRKIPDAVASLRQGEWKRSRFVGVEIHHKVLGVVGLGKIGREVARRARGLGMRVLAADAFVAPEVAQREGVELVDFPTLLRESDYITLHTPLTRDTRGLLDDEALALVKPGVRILNCARGGILDEGALLRALEAGRVAGAALDVFEKEPPARESPLLRHPAVICTPHLGASTEEAQINVAVDVADQVLQVLRGRPPRSAVNLPALSSELFARIEPYYQLGYRIGKLHAQLADSPIEAVEITYYGDLVELDVQPVTRAVLMGLLQPILAQSVNIVNAPVIAEQRGIRVTETKAAGESDYASYLRVEVRESDRRRMVGGTVLGRKDLRIREIDQFQIDMVPEGHLVLEQHVDRPGIIGQVGTMLGEAGINIAGMYVGREAAGKRAIMVLNVDDPVPQPILESIRSEIRAEQVRRIEL